MAEFVFPETARRISESISAVDETETIDLDDVDLDADVIVDDEQQQQQQQQEASSSQGGQQTDSAQNKS
jgi:hypothetical protein